MNINSLCIILKKIHNGLILNKEFLKKVKKNFFLSKMRCTFTMISSINIINLKKIKVMKTQLVEKAMNLFIETEPLEHMDTKDPKFMELYNKECELYQLFGEMSKEEMLEYRKCAIEFEWKDFKFTFDTIEEYEYSRAGGYIDLFDILRINASYSDGSSIDYPVKSREEFHDCLKRDLESGAIRFEIYQDQHYYDVADYL